MEDIIAVSIWLWVDTEQIQTDVYIIDGRYGDPEAYYSSSAIGILWEKMYIDGTQPYLFENPQIGWSYVPKDAWMHFHLEAGHAFTDDVNVASRVAGGDNNAVVGCLKGKVAEIYFWADLLTDVEIQIIATGFNQQAAQGFLLAVYPLEDGEGDVFVDALGKQEDGKLINGPVWILEAPVLSGVLALHPPPGPHPPRPPPPPPKPPPTPPPQPPEPPISPPEPPGSEPPFADLSNTWFVTILISGAVGMYVSYKLFMLIIPPAPAKEEEKKEGDEEAKDEEKKEDDAVPKVAEEESKGSGNKVAPEESAVSVLPSRRNKGPSVDDLRRQWVVKMQATLSG
ncbi:hypothetical protein CYMTET_21541 [Cymbomonas tetramitiformis]|uniref:Uncharacterized protein n=1 Tax=Cymbomonas tetramitiformis TaxID=36881 RepID=A0AAE0G277_9CHLO|nr:hypothetical protein CYMTET_21541 [Cymbomonas tetramitiformis]